MCSLLFVDTVYLADTFFYSLLEIPHFLPPFCSFFSLSLHRYENLGEFATGHTAYARKRTPSVFLCLLYIWNNWGTALGWTSTEPLFLRGKLYYVSKV